MLHTKQDYRKHILSIRNNFINRTSADNDIYKKLILNCDKFTRIFAYISYSSEVDTISFINEMLKRNKEIFVPVCNVNDCTMEAAQVYNTDDLKRNEYAILEPKERIINNKKIDVIILPGSVFDINGNRIGYGKGYYDKYIKSLNYNPLKIGVCYDFQLLDTIPTETHDVKMDIILTESRNIYL